jgi:hypothetical protein
MVAVGAQNSVNWMMPDLGVPKTDIDDPDPYDNDWYNWQDTVYRRMDSNERLKFATIRVTTSYFGGEQSWMAQTMIGDDIPWLFSKLATVSPSAYGDFCHYQGAPVRDVLGNIGGISSIVPKIDPKGSGRKTSYRNTFVRADLLLNHSDVFTIYATGMSEGARYWMDRMFPALVGPKEPMISLEYYYDRQFARLSARDKTILTYLLLTDITYDPGSQSPLKEKMRKQSSNLAAQLSRKAIMEKFKLWESLNFEMTFRDRLLRNLDDLLGHPLK